MDTIALRKAGFPGTDRRAGKSGAANPSDAAARDSVNRMAATALEGDFLPETGAFISFLINALYLFGDNAIVAFGGLPEKAAAGLAGLGHRVEAAPSRRGPGAPGRFDRAVSLARTFGRGDDAEILARLREMRRAVRPGGLVSFHTIDRDHAWAMAGMRHVSAEEGPARVEVRFDPVAGRLSARPAGASGADAGWTGTGSALAVRAWNRAEIETLLRVAGLRLERIYGDWEGRSPEASASGRLIVVASKPRRTRRNAKGDTRS